MDEINQELKKIQLEREKLALKREQTLQSIANTTAKWLNKFFNAIQIGVQKSISLFWLLVGKWKICLLLIIFIFLANLGRIFYQKIQEDRYQAAATEFANTSCKHIKIPENCKELENNRSNDLNNYGFTLHCMQEEAELAYCESSAKAKFERINASK